MHSSGIIFYCLILIAALAASSCSLIDQNDVASPQPVAPAPDETGTLIVESVTVPTGQAGSFQYTGVPTGTIPADGTLVVADLAPGTYSSTVRDPAPEFDVTAVSCDDEDSASVSRGDPQTRTAIFNVDPGETVRCTFTLARRGSVVVLGRTEPDGAAGVFQFTGVPSGTVPGNGTLVVANLVPGTYSTTERNPAPVFDLTAVECDDGTSPTASSSDSQTRTAIFNVDPGEMVTCTFTNTRRGTAIVVTESVPEDAAGSFQFTGVPSGTVPGRGTLVAADLTPGTYTTTEIDPSPEFELTAVECDDSNSQSASSGDAQTRTAVYNLDPGETIICRFVNEAPTSVITPTLESGSSLAGSDSDNESLGKDPTETGVGTNPFENPSQLLENFPLPSELPPGAGTYDIPKAGPWSVTNFAGQMSCGEFGLSIPAGPREDGILEVLDDGQKLVGTGLQDAEGVSITLNADPKINGRYSGTAQGVEQGVPVAISYFWQVITDEYIIGYLTAEVSAQGISCNVYRAFEMIYTG